MGTDDRRTLHPQVDDEHLKYAIYLLRYRQPETNYPEAWGLLTAEADRRREGVAAFSVQMARTVFEALPTVVQDLLTGESQP
jgi:hypothetical protein